ncbi:MAG: hypothetical protein PHG25_00050 [Candidatus Pacebacteria bacterium]|nr:hypothetical protein [Candidatus Paceibacterota bacterium]
MVQIDPIEFIGAWKCLEQVIKLSGEKRGQKATKDEAEFLIKALIEVHYISGRLGFRQSVELCNRLLDQLKDPACHRIWSSAGIGRFSYTMPKEIPLPDFESVYWQVEGVASEVRKEMAAIRLAVVFGGKMKNLDQEKPFGDSVYQNFPGARSDIKDAYQSLSVGLNTAAIFHLMRVTEHGVRALAKAQTLNLTFACPIEYSTWGQVIGAIDDKLKQLKKGQKSNAREEELQFYSELVAETRAFQILWRDPVMHVRSRFDRPDQAEDAFQHVLRFMTALSKRVSEAT